MTGYEPRFSQRLRRVRSRDQTYQSRPTNPRPTNQDRPINTDQSKPTNQDRPIKADQSRPTNQDRPIKADQSRPTNHNEPCHGKGKGDTVPFFCRGTVLFFHISPKKRFGHKTSTFRSQMNDPMSCNRRNRQA